MQTSEHTIGMEFFPGDMATLEKRVTVSTLPSDSLSHRQECSPWKEFLNREITWKMKSEKNRIDNAARPMQHLMFFGAIADALDV